MKEQKRKTTFEMKNDPYSLVVFLDSNRKAQGDLYIDDEETMKYLEGDYALIKIEYRKNDFDVVRVSGNRYVDTVAIENVKVYENQEWDYGYRETDRLGGHDPYSASKAAAELAIASWRASFCGEAVHQNPHLAIATARAGNVIGGGDWAEDRIVPDAMRALAAGRTIPVRNPRATRPWQHVLEPIGGYLRLAEALSVAATIGNGAANPCCDAFNFGPALEANRPVHQLIEEALRHWPGQWQDLSEPGAPHEAGRLHLQIDKAHHQLGWEPNWTFATTVQRTVAWYNQVAEDPQAAESCCLADLQAYAPN
jgi:CDP-glucose 4,6-dehydratase